MIKKEDSPQEFKSKVKTDEKRRERVEYEFRIGDRLPKVIMEMYDISKNGTNDNANTVVRTTFHPISYAKRGVLHKNKNDFGTISFAIDASQGPKNEVCDKAQYCIEMAISRGIESVINAPIGKRFAIEGKDAASFEKKI